MKTTAPKYRKTLNIRYYILMVIFFGFSYFAIGQKIDNETLKPKSFQPINSLSAEANNIDPNFIAWYRDNLNKQNDSLSNGVGKNLHPKSEIQQNELATTPPNISNTFAQPKSAYPPESRDFRKLGYSTALYVGAGLAVFGVLMLMPENITNWSSSATDLNNLAKSHSKNLGLGPVIDHDNPFINYVSHPYCGSVYYMTARSAGFKPIESFGYSFLMSAVFWEYGIEAFAEIPSIQDVFSTPVVGSIMGEGFYHVKKSVKGNNGRLLNSKFLGTTALVLVDPFNTLLDACGYKQKSKVSIQTSVTPVAFSGSRKTNWGLGLRINY